MPRTKLKDFSEEEQRKLLRKFFIAIASLRNYNEVGDFFKDLLYQDEMAMLVRRLRVAQLLEEGLTYEEIAASMSVGYDTIAKVNYWLNNGSGGYKKVIKSLNKIEDRIESKRIRRAKENNLFSVAWLQKKYRMITKEDLDDLTDDFNNFIKRIRKNRSLYKG